MLNIEKFAYNQALEDSVKCINEDILNSIIYAETPELMIKNINKLKKSILNLKK